MLINGTEIVQSVVQKRKRTYLNGARIFSYLCIYTHIYSKYLKKIHSFCYLMFSVFIIMQRVYVISTVSIDSKIGNLNLNFAGYIQEVSWTASRKFPKKISFFLIKIKYLKYLLSSSGNES